MQTLNIGKVPFPSNVCQSLLPRLLLASRLTGQANTLANLQDGILISQVLLDIFLKLRDMCFRAGITSQLRHVTYCCSCGFEVGNMAFYHQD